MKKILILANENERAAISCLRALNHSKADVYIAFSSKSIKNRIIFKKYMNKNINYYDNNSKKKFIKSLLNIQEEIGGYFLLNFGDKLTRWIIESRSDLERNGIEIKSPDLTTFDLMLNKHSFMDISVKYNIDVPQEIAAEEYLKINGFKEKFVIKAKSNEIYDDETSVLKIPMLVENSDSWKRLKEKRLDLDKHFVQRYIDGPSFYYCALYNDGDKIAHFTQKNIVQQPGGKSVIKAVPSQLPKDIIDKIDRMMLDCKWEGVMMLELKEQNNKYYAIECNPRFWGPLQLAIDNGIEFPSYIAGINTPQKKDVNKYGYIWLTGYLLGILYKLQTKTSFQRHFENTENGLIYKDIWLRKDTLIYFILEFPFTISGQFKKIIKMKQ